MGLQSEKGDRSSRHARFASEQTSANAKIQGLTTNLTPNFVCFIQLLPKIMPPLLIAKCRVEDWRGIS
jgi:hypothetical protein